MCVCVCTHPGEEGACMWMQQEAAFYTGQKCGFWVQIFVQPPSSYAALGTFGSPACIWCSRDYVCLDQSMCVCV